MGFCQLNICDVHYDLSTPQIGGGTVSGDAFLRLTELPQTRKPPAPCLRVRASYLDYVRAGPPKYLGVILHDVSSMESALR